MITITLEKDIVPQKGHMQVIKLKNNTTRVIKLLDVYVEETLQRFSIELGDVRGLDLVPGDTIDILLSCTKDIDQIYQVKNVLDIKVDYV